MENPSNLEFTVKKGGVRKMSAMLNPKLDRVGKYLLWAISFIFYLNVGYVVALDAEKLCQNISARSSWITAFWLNNGAISYLCPANSESFAWHIFALWEILWVFAYLLGALHWAFYFIFQGGIVEYLGLIVR